MGMEMLMGGCSEQEDGVVTAYEGEEGEVGAELGRDGARGCWDGTDDLMEERALVFSVLVLTICGSVECFKTRCLRRA